ncbi:MMPL family transporter [Pelagicoccus sp. SDUM812005]|uniref:efflux RND transporter permease subunit n=1 Tax=Pelagicoccus sp. SDUM812005 TaxID=3041257 RepID=UPI0028103A7A|nr:MMPL family transporter [Pelagicoccus sp. SDUM812005]MDQ8180698.1 MMPL family transporter [Pelagicoccus sp. SDUM812005]
MKTTPPTNNKEQPLWLRRPYLLLSLLAGLFLLLAWQSLRFEINASAETLVDEDNPFYKRTQKFDARFQPQEFLLIAYEPIDRPLFSERTLKDLAAIGDAISQFPRVENVRSILNVPLLQLSEKGLDPNLDPERWTLQKLDIPLSKLPELFSGHPIYEDLLVNAAQTATSLQVTFKRNDELDRIQAEKLAASELPENEQDPQLLDTLKVRVAPIQKELAAHRNREIEAIRDIIADYQSDARVYLGGEQALAYQLVQIIRNDLIVFGSAIAIVASLTLLALFRSLRWVLIPAISCLYCVVSTIGLFAAFGLKGTVISANFVSLQIVLTLAIVIHLIVQYREEQRAKPQASAQELSTRVFRKKAKPCLYSALTTSIGFASLIFSGIQPITTFGIMMVVAMFASSLASLALFPLLVSLFPKGDSPQESRLTERVVGAFRKGATRSPRSLLAASAIVFTLASLGVARLSVENSFINYFADSTVVHQELSFIDQQFGGSTPLDVIYEFEEAEDPALVATAAQVQTLQSLQTELGSIAGVGKALSLVNFTELAKSLNQGRPLTEYELSAAYHTIDESLRDQLLGSFYSPEHRQARISLRIADSTPELDRAALLASIHEKAAALQIPSDRYQLSNLFVLYQDLLQSLYRSQALTLGIVALGVFVCFLAVFRSLPLALACMAPNVISTGIVLGLMGWCGIALDFMTMTIASVAMGISVDDTIHYVHRYQEERQAGHSPQDAVSRTHRSVGFAILYTTIVVVSGFSLLAFSDFIPSVWFGLLTALSISIALAADLLTLPALLLVFPNKQKGAN